MDIHEILIRTLVKIQDIEDVLRMCSCGSNFCDYDCTSKIGESLDLEDTCEDLIKYVEKLKSKTEN